MRTANKTFAEVTEGLLALVAQSKRFKGFVMPQTMKDEIIRCADVFKGGHEGEAVRLGTLATTGLTNLLTAFFRNSPAYFDRLLKEFNPQDFDKDLWDKLLSEHGFYLQQARSQQQLTVEQCAECYCYMLETLEWVKNEQERRVRNRAARLAQKQAEQQAARLAAEERRKEEQRELARQQREKVANELLSAIA